MYGHRSIVRIKRNPARERSINICLIIIVYIFINLIFSDYWLYINGTVLIFILVFFSFYHCKSNNEEPDSEDEMSDIENTCYIDNDDISFDSNTSHPTIIALPIPPSGLSINDCILEVNATEI